MSCFSIRGKFTLADSGRNNPVRIFDYVSPDRTRAWRVTRAYLWPITTRASIGSTEGKALCQATLFTDDGVSISWDNISDPTENRAFAWAQWNGYIRDATADDFMTAEGVDGIVEFLIDPDPMIVKELWIAAASTTESGTNPDREWGYLIVMDEVAVSPSQSVYQQIKGMGQNING